MKQKIRPVTAQDIEGLKVVLTSTDLFPPELLDDMIAEYLQNKATETLWFTYIYDGQPIALGYCAPETFTNGTYNLYAIGVDKAHQGKGIGRQMMAYLEGQLRERNARILIVETSGTADFSLTRTFYAKCGYTQEAVIREFYDKGDDKVVFWKHLGE